MTNQFGTASLTADPDARRALIVRDATANVAAEMQDELDAIVWLMARGAREMWTQEEDAGLLVGWDWSHGCTSPCAECDALATQHWADQTAARAYYETPQGCQAAVNNLSALVVRF